MAHVMGFNISLRDKIILAILLSYRGVTAKQLTIFVMGNRDYTLSEEKSIYNSLRKLKKQGLIFAFKLQETVSNGSMYYLSPKGYSLALDLLNVEAGQKGEGWLPYESSFETNFADLPYEVYSPPKKQTAHHLMLVDLFLQLIEMGDEIPEGIPHRLNLYASQKYLLKDGPHMEPRKLRPDGEILINSKRYTIEIDRATENHEQLVEKFKIYKAYFEHCKRNGEINTIQGIIFVVEDRRRMHGINRRWASLLAAYVKVLYPEWRHIPLILTSKIFITETILGERAILNDTIEDVKTRNDHMMSSYHTQPQCEHYYFGTQVQTNNMYTIHYGADSAFSCYNSVICHQYDSRLFSTYIHLKKNIVSTLQAFPEKYVKGFKYRTARIMVWYTDIRLRPVLVDLEPYGIDPAMSKVFKEAVEFADFYHNPAIKEDSESKYTDYYDFYTKW